MVELVTFTLLEGRKVRLGLLNGLSFTSEADLRSVDFKAVDASTSAADWIIVGGEAYRFIKCSSFAALAALARFSASCNFFILLSYLCFFLDSVVCYSC